LLLEEQDEDGRDFVYTYDSLKRLKTKKLVGVAATSEYPAQSDCVETYTYDAADRILSVVTNAGGLTLSNSFISMLQVDSKP